MNALVESFIYQDHPLRVKQDGDGEPLFHAGDLCALLEYKNPRDALRRHVDTEDVVRRDTLTEGGPQQANFVREPGLWALILGSETKGAKQVRRWVVAEVLPAIRTTGGYGAAPNPQEATALAAGLAAELLQASPYYTQLRRYWCLGLSVVEIARLTQQEREQARADLEQLNRLHLLPPQAPPPLPPPTLETPLTPAQLAAQQAPDLARASAATRVTAAERQRMHRLRSERFSIREIAARTGRDKATVCRALGPVTPDEVQQIRALAAEGHNQREIAAQVGRGRETVGKILQAADQSGSEEDSE